ncbi:accessory gene regulator B family protein [Cohnella panacarvi]|uniref:accessory gene regulator ArgB-like protein n=1 Tax=Cohnella panacarvi TaxID=400776 RepID=UPI00047E088C
MIRILSRGIAKKIKTVVPHHPVSEQVLAYSISFLLNTIFVILFSMLVSLFTGRYIETAIALFSYAIIRQASGGFHFESGWLCIVASTAAITAISFSNFGDSILIILTFLSLLIALVFSPSRIEKQTRIPKRYYPLLKVLSMVIISTSFLFGSSVVTTSFFVQSLTLIRYGKEVRTNL